MDNTDTLNALIEGGKQLLQEENFNSSKLKVWSLQVKRNLQSLYDDEVADDFDRTVNGGAVIHMGATASQLYHDTYRPKIQRAVEYLESLLAMEIPKQVPKPDKTNAASHRITVSHGGNVMVGDHNTVNLNNVTMGDILTTLESEVRSKVADGPEKHGALSAIKTLTSNETFNTVVSQTLGTFLAHLAK